MATSKTKGTSKKIKELKGIKPEKISKDQLKKLQDTIDNINRTQLEIGSLETRKHVMLHNVAVLRDKLTLLQEDFEKEYGTYDVNIKDGVINYKE
jgi:hypothetical protein